MPEQGAPVQPRAHGPRDPGSAGGVERYAWPVGVLVSTVWRAGPLGEEKRLIRGMGGVAELPVAEPSAAPMSRGQALVGAPCRVPPPSMGGTRPRVAGPRAIHGRPWQN
ncbi:hypothetical protein GCM10028789_12480 [Sinomonas halotolerans]